MRNGPSLAMLYHISTFILARQTKPNEDLILDTEKYSNSKTGKKVHSAALKHYKCFAK